LTELERERNCPEKQHQRRNNEKWSTGKGQLCFCSLLELRRGGEAEQLAVKPGSRPGHLTPASVRTCQGRGEEETPRCVFVSLGAALPVAPLGSGGCSVAAEPVTTVSAWPWGCCGRAAADGTAQRGRAKGCGAHGCAPTPWRGIGRGTEVGTCRCPRLFPRSLPASSAERAAVGWRWQR